jgi:hypothetical protein
VPTFRLPSSGVLAVLDCKTGPTPQTNDAALRGEKKAVVTISPNPKTVRLDPTRNRIHREVFRTIMFTPELIAIGTTSRMFRLLMMHPAGGTVPLMLF